ncbi:MAG: hypothetical protein ACOYPS_12090, partial [Phycisphaerales bacterium]
MPTRMGGTTRRGEQLAAPAFVEARVATGPPAPIVVEWPRMSDPPRARREACPQTLAALLHAIAAVHAATEGRGLITLPSVSQLDRIPSRVWLATTPGRHADRFATLEQVRVCVGHGAAGPSWHVATQAATASASRRHKETSPRERACVGDIDRDS